MREDASSISLGWGGSRNRSTGETISRLRGGILSGAHRYAQAHERPLEVGAQRRLHVESAFGLLEPQPARMETLSLQPGAQPHRTVALGIAVARVADHGKPVGQTMGADLVGPTGPGFGLQQ